MNKQDKQAIRAAITQLAVLLAMSATKADRLLAAADVLEALIARLRERADEAPVPLTQPKRGR